MATNLKHYQLHPRPLEGQELIHFLNKVERRDRCFTNKEMMRLPEGIRVKIKDSATSVEDYRTGGYLVFQTRDMLEDNERLFGIVSPDWGICFDFKAQDYEVISIAKEERYYVDKSKPSY